MATKKKEPKKPRCPDCGGTGLRADKKKDSALCHCLAGQRRDAASCWD